MPFVPNKAKAEAVLRSEKAIPGKAQPGRFDLAAAMPVVACVLRTGGGGSRHYTGQHVHWLYRQLQCRVLNAKWEMVCFTDDRELLNNSCLPFSTVAIPQDEKGWWAKIHLFGHWRNAECLRTVADSVFFLDLDTVLRHPFWIPKAEKGVLHMLKAFTDDCSGWMSGVMMWHPRDRQMRDIEKAFMANAKTYQWCCRGLAGGDQEFIAMQRLMRNRTIKAIDDLLGVVRFDHADARPNAPIVAWFGPEKPWTHPTPFTPPLWPASGVGDIVLIGAWFGTLHDKARLDAAREGLRQWTRMRVRPRIVVAVAGTNPFKDFADIRGLHVLQIPVYPENEFLWAKERLWNIAGRLVLKKWPELRGLVCCDLDGCFDHPDPFSLIAQEFQFSEVFQPFRVMLETAPDGTQDRMLSYAYQKLTGNQCVYSGQGFCHCVRSDYFKLVGGFPDTSVEGGGDAVTILSWDANCVHSRNLKDKFPDWWKQTAGYCPKTPIGVLPFEMNHVWHGARRGDADTRHYWSRHYVWELCGGRMNVVEDDPRNGLWKWKDTPEARAARVVRENQGELKTEEAVREAYEKALKEG